VLIDTARTSRVTDYIATMRRLTRLPVRLVLGGHRDPMNRERMLEIAESYLAAKAASLPPAPPCC
jgi:glyoxylase-like metal-dependent hydrolase (beta-lactamase superfamily II)